MFKVIVTGATGFIGGALCQELLKEDMVVYGVGRNPEVLNKLNRNGRFIGIPLDFDRYNQLDRIIKDRDFDVLFHLANYGVNGADKENYELQLTNAAVACNMVETAHNLGCKRFIFAGSVDEFEAFCKPDSKFVLPTHSRIYGISKYTAECMGKVIASKLGMEYVAALLCLTYGEGNKTNILPNVMIKNSFVKKPVNLIEGGNTFDIIYIEEAVRALITLARNGKNMESYYVGHESLRTFREIVEEINNCLDNPVELRFGQYKDRGTPIQYESIDRSKMLRDTGFKCDVSIKEGVEKTKSWILGELGIQ